MISFDQLYAWLPRANSRYTRTCGGRPADIVIADRAAMRPLGPIVPEAVFRKEIRLPRGYYVRVHSNDYCVDPSAIGRLVQVTADLDTVTVTAGTTVLARPERRWARHQIFTDPAHVSRAAELRRDYRTPWHGSRQGRQSCRSGIFLSTTRPSESLPRVTLLSWLEPGNERRHHERGQGCSVLRTGAAGPKDRGTATGT